MKSFTRVFLAPNLVAKTWVHDDNSTDVEVTFYNEVNVPIVTANGHTKLNPTDIFDPEVGKAIAFGRALERFGQKYTRYAESLSETPSMRKGRIRISKRIYEQGLVVDQLKNEFNQLQRIEEREQKKGQNAPQEATTALEAAEVTEVVPATT